jgi:hypothetical protein
MLELAARPCTASDVGDRQARDAAKPGRIVPRWG